MKSFLNYLLEGFAKEIDTVVDFNKEPKSDQFRFDFAFSLDDIEERFEYALQMSHGMKVVYEFEVFLESIVDKNKMESVDLSKYKISSYKTSEAYVDACGTVFDIFFKDKVYAGLLWYYNDYTKSELAHGISKEDIFSYNDWLADMGNLDDINDNLSLTDQFISDDYEFDGTMIVPHANLDPNNKREFGTLMHSVYKLIANTFNTKVRINSSKTVKIKKKPDTWYIELDESLKHDDGTSIIPEHYTSAEIVTSHIPVKNFESIFVKFHTLFEKNYKVKSNETTGFHVNLVLKKPIDFIKLIIMTKDDDILSLFGRKFNGYCKSQYNILVNNIKRKLMINRRQIRGKIDLTNFDEINELIDKQIRINTSDEFMDKYRSINFLKYESGQMIEFRIIGDDYLDVHYQETIKTIKKFIFMMIIASSEDMYKEEYQKMTIDLCQEIENKLAARISINSYS